MKKISAILLLSAVVLTSCGTQPTVTETQTETAAETSAATAEAITTDAESAVGEVSFTESITFKKSKEILIKSGTWAPRVCAYGGVLLAGVESPSGIIVLKSEDGGVTWKDPVAASFYPGLNCANVNFYGDGDTLYLAYRATSDKDGARYTSLRVSESKDGGRTWSEHSTVCEYTDKAGRGGVWEPYLIRINGELTCVYANDLPSATSRQNIEYRIWNGEKWIKRTIISRGEDHDSRDGMPVLCRTPDGGYVCVIESTAERNKGYPFVLKAFYSDDGVSWSEPVTIYTPKTAGSKAAAPGVVYLPDGRLAVSFQTDEDATVKGDGTSVMKFIVSDGTDIRDITEKSFTAPENIFNTRDGDSSIWTGIFFDGENIYAAAGTKRGSVMKKVCVINAD